MNGDLSLKDKDRNLMIRGRASKAMNVGGTKVSPEPFGDQNSNLSSIRGVGGSEIDGPDGLQEICAANLGTLKLTIEDVSDGLLRPKPRWPIQRVAIVPAIAQTEIGEIDRVALRHLFSDEV